MSFSRQKWGDYTAARQDFNYNDTWPIVKAKWVWPEGAPAWQFSLLLFLENKTEI